VWGHEKWGECQYFVSLAVVASSQQVQRVSVHQSTVVSRFSTVWWVFEKASMHTNKLCVSRAYFQCSMGVIVVRTHGV
jgi:hypothetical protein